MPAASQKSAGSPAPPRPASDLLERHVEVVPHAYATFVILSQAGRLTTLEVEHLIRRRRRRHRNQTPLPVALRDLRLPRDETPASGFFGMITVATRRPLPAPGRVPAGCALRSTRGHGGRSQGCPGRRGGVVRTAPGRCGSAPHTSRPPPGLGQAPPQSAPAGSTG